MLARRQRETKDRRGESNQQRASREQELRRNWYIISPFSIFWCFCAFPAQAAGFVEYTGSVVAPYKLHAHHDNHFVTVSNDTDYYVLLYTNWAVLIQWWRALCTNEQFRVSESWQHNILWSVKMCDDDHKLCRLSFSLSLSLSLSLSYLH